MRRWLILLLPFLLIQMGDAIPRVQLIGVRPILSEQEPLEFQVRVPREATHRRLIVEAVDHDGPVTSGSYDLDGDSAPIRDLRWWLPSGEYVLIAAVYDRHGEVGRDARPVIVRGRFD